MKENQSGTVVKGVKTASILELLQEGARDLSVDLGSIPSTRRSSGKWWPRSRSQGSVAGGFLRGDMTDGGGIVPGVTVWDSAKAGWGSVWPMGSPFGPYHFFFFDRQGV